MIKLMIVDDEASIRKGLRQYINWSAWDIELVAEAANASEAEAKALQLRPDILISDIRMPDESGLALCGRLRKSLPGLRILLLTGYDDKEYLHSALAIGVREYLLKPAGAETIISSVLKLKDEILAERDKEQRFLEQKSLLDENFTVLQMNFIMDLINGRGGNRGQLHSKAHMLEIPLKGPCYQTAKVFFGEPEGEYISSHEMYQDYWRLVQILTTVSQQVENSFFCELEPQEYILLVNGATPADADSHIRKFAHLLEASAKQKAGYNLQAGIGSPVTSPQKIAVSYQRAKDAFEVSAWEDGQIFAYPQAPGGSAQEQAVSRELERKYIAEVSAGGRQSALEQYDELAKHLRSTRTEMAVVREYARSLLDFTAHLSHKKTDGQAFQDYLCHLEGFYNGNELLSWLRSQLETLLVTPEGELPAYSPIVQKAIAYMRIHYQQDITLQTLSKEIFISPNYLGRLFRQETGFKLNEWLNHYRIDRAKELLRDPELRTADIAEQVGFNSYKYFSICFQKFAECSLGDYRRECIHKTKPR